MPGLRNLAKNTSSSLGGLPVFQLSQPDASSSSSNKDPAAQKKIKSANTFAMDSLKRHSLAAMGKAKHTENRKPSPSPAALHRKPANSLDIAIESPPAIFYGNANTSTGALYAGQVRLTVVDPEVTLSTFTMTLLATVLARKPVVKDCTDCSTKITELKQWTFLTHPKTYTAGTHSVPFSYLIPGHLPITTHGELGRLQYFLDAKAVMLPKPNSTGFSSVDSVITMRHEVKVKRAVRPLDEKISLRIFPPTNLAARVTHAPIIHPIGGFNIQMQLSGIKTTTKDNITRWRLRKMNWRLEETEKMVSPACPKHSAKVGGQGRGIGHEDTRTIGRDELKSGWKTDLSDGTIELEFVCRPNGNPAPLCDVESPTGLVVTHSLVVELIIAEEWAPVKAPERATPTGAARVLRMQFAVTITERSGMGIAWDEEMPPMYEDVPESPPLYPADRNPPAYPEGVTASAVPSMQRIRSEMLDYHGTPLGPPPPFEEEEFEGLTLGPSRIQHRTAESSASADSSSGWPGSQQRTTGDGAIRPPSSSSSGRGRSRLSIADFETGDAT